jgi:hypothetical protein
MDCVKCVLQEVRDKNNIFCFIYKESVWLERQPQALLGEIWQCNSLFGLLISSPPRTALPATTLSHGR